MAMQPDPWIFTDRRITAQPSRSGLVALGEWAVPAEVTCRLMGAKDLPPGRRWPDVFMRFEVRDGAAVCAEFRVLSEADDRPIRSGDLRIFDLDELALVAFTSLGMKRTESGGFAHGASEEDSREARRSSAPGVRGLIQRSYRDPQSELREVARVYLDPQSRRKPTASVMSVLGYGSRETTVRRVREARKAGLIPHAKATGEELDAAYQALREGDQGE